MFEGFGNVWTPAVTAKELGKRPLQVRIGGEALVLFRDGRGGLGALIDRCPHRGVALSGGTIDADGCLTCPFHAWSFQKDGACAKIPLNDLSPDKRMRHGATPVPSREAGGLIWIYTGPDTAGSEPELPPALVEPGWYVGFTQQIWKTHWTRAMENMLDMAHLPYVHGRSFAKDIKKKLRSGTQLEVHVEAAPFGSRIFSKWDWEPDALEILKWRRPNGMELHILDEKKRKIYLHVYCIPVDQDHTKMLVCSARTFFGANAITWLLTKFNDVLSEDRVIVETSKPAEIPQPAEEPSVATDAPTLYFRKYYYRELRGSSSILVPAGRLLRKDEDAGRERAESTVTSPAA